MIRKHAVLIGLTLSLLFFVMAISIYPGGSMFDRNDIGFRWSKNFISNLFSAKAINGEYNPSRIWAWLGMILLPVSYAIFFSHMAKKIPGKGVGNLLRYLSLANILCMVLIVTPWHDLMLYLSISLFWTCMVIITVLVLKTKLNLFKFLCVACLVVFYYSIYLWAISDWDLLPTMQKVNVIDSTLLILGLEYFTKPDDFAHIRPGMHKRKSTKR